MFDQASGREGWTEKLVLRGHVVEPRLAPSTSSGRRERLQPSEESDNSGCSADHSRIREWVVGRSSQRPGLEAKGRSGTAQRRDGLSLQGDHQEAASDL